MNFELIWFSWKIKKTCRQNQIKWRNVNVIWPSGLSKCLWANLGKCIWLLSTEPSNQAAYLPISNWEYTQFAKLRFQLTITLRFCDYFDWSLFYKIQAWNIMNRELLFLNMGFFCNNFNTFHQIRNCPPQLYIHNTSKEKKWTFLKRNDCRRPIFRSILLFYCLQKKIE